MKKIVTILLMCALIFCSACGCTQKEKPQELLPGSAEVNINDIITFGNYEQDNDLSNGKEPIDWVVLKKTDNKVLLLSKYVLDFKAFADDRWDTWENCKLRTWLNGEFINSAFSLEEQQKILTTTLEELTERYGGLVTMVDATNDKVFCLSVYETIENFKNIEYGATTYTKYATSKEGYNDRFEGVYLLRTVTVPNALYGPKVAHINSSEEIIMNDISRTTPTGIRPAIWVELSN